MIWIETRRTVLGLFLVALASLLMGQAAYVGPGATRVPIGASGSPGGGYQGPGDIVSPSVLWVGLRAISAAGTGNPVANICNSGDANCVDIKSLSNGSFDTLTARAAPLNCGGSGGTCTVKILYDQSGANNCSGPCNFTNATAAARPTLAFNCVDWTQPCMQFNGTSQVLASVSASASIAQPFTVSTVAITTGNFASQGDISIDQSGARLQVVHGSANSMSLFQGGGNAVFTAADNHGHAIQAIFDNANGSSVFVDGASASVNIGVNDATSGTIINLGGAPTFGGEFWTGQIMEFGVFSVHATAGQQTALNANQSSFYFGASSAFTYFADLINGNDANNGRSPGLALQNVTAIPPVQSGWSIGLACNGSHWRQELDAFNTGNVTISGYGACTQASAGGTGSTLPILDAADIIPNSNFTKTVGFTNVYTTGTITFALVGSSSNTVNVWEAGGPSDAPNGGSFLVNVTSQALVDSTLCSYFIPGYNASTVPASGTISIHTCDGTSPITNGYTYDFSNRGQGIGASGSNITVRNLEVRKGGGVNGTLALEGDNEQDLADNVIVRDGSEAVLGIPGGSTIQNSLVINGYNLNFCTQLLAPFDAVSGAGLPFTIRNNILQQDQNIPGNCAIPITKQIDAAGTDGNFTIDNNWMIAKNGSMMVASILATTTASAAVSNNKASGVQGFWIPNIATTLLNNQATLAACSSGCADQRAIKTKTTSLVTATGNKFCGTNLASSLIEVSQSSTFTSSGNLYYSTFASGSHAIILGSANNVAIQSSSDDFGTGTSGAPWFPIAVPNNTGATFSGGNNIYENTAQTPFWTLNSAANITTYPAWQATAGVTDTGSTVGAGNAVSACTLPTMPIVN